MKTKAILLAAVCGLTGCATSLDNAGFDQYTVRAVKDKNGKTDGYELEVKSGKEYKERGVQFQADGPRAVLTIGETEVKAFRGPAITAKALSVFPVTDLANILVGGDRTGK